MTCQPIIEVCKGANDRKPYGFNLTASLARNWAPGLVFAEGDVIRPLRRPTGFEYVAGGDGQTGHREPNWPTELGGTVQDGSITWTCQAISADSLLRTIAQSTWAGDSGISVNGETVMNGASQRTGAYVSGGTAGQSYMVVNTVEFSDGAIIEYRLHVSVEAPPA